MTIIKKLSEMITEELEGACNYAKCALKYKEERPGLAKTFFDLSNDEMEHVNALHDEVTKIIEAYRKEHGEPPETMMALYEYLHEMHIEKANKIRLYQEQFKKY